MLDLGLGGTAAPGLERLLARLVGGSASVRDIEAEGFHEIVPDTGHVRHPVQKPRDPVLAVNVVSLVSHAAAVLQAGEPFRFAEVPLLGEDQPEALRHRSIEVVGVGMEPVPLVHRAPVLVGVTLLAGIIGRKSLRGDLAMPSVGVDDYLVRGVRVDWSGHSRKVSCYKYKCTYNI